MSQQRALVVQVLVLLGVAAGLGSFAYFGIYEKDTRAQAKKEHSERLFAPQTLGERQADGGAAKAEFTSLTIFARGETTRLERKPGHDWFIVAPLGAKADRLVVDGVVSQLQTARFKTALEETPDAATLARYGLEAPSFWVEASAEVGDPGEARTVRLEGGLENTFDGSVYMRRGGEPTVYMAEGGVRFALQKTTFELRDKLVLDFDPDQVKTLAIKTQANEWALARTAEKSWTFVKPAQELADGVQIDALLGQLKSERALSFPEDTPSNRKAFGLDAPIAEVWLAQSDGRQVHLSLGRPTGDAGQSLYALREEAMTALLCEVGPGARSFDRNPADLRDHTVIPFKKELTAKIVFHASDGSEVVVAKGSADAGAEAWRVVAPRPGPARVFKITGALWALASQKFGLVVEEKPKELAKYGLDAKARFVAFFDGEGKELARVTIGSELPKKPGTFYVLGLRDQVVEVEGARFPEIPWKLDDLSEAPATTDAGP